MNTHIIKILVLISIGLGLFGCAQAFLDITPPSFTSNILLKVDKIEIQSRAEIKTPTGLGIQDQKQFHDAITNNLSNMVKAVGENTDRKAVFVLDQVGMSADVPMSVHGRNIPILGFFFFGQDIKYSAIIKGVVEIENTDKKVISRGDFYIKTEYVGRSDTQEDAIEGMGTVANSALAQLHKTVYDSCRRYISEYLVE